MSLTRQELHDLAAAGVTATVQEMERRLALLHKEWPHLFVSPTPPVLLAPALKPAASNGNGHWPAVLAAAAPARPPARGGGAVARVAAREQQILALVAQHPLGVTPLLVRAHLHLDASTTIRALGRLCRHQQLRLAARGRYVLPGTPAAAPAATPTTAPPTEPRGPRVWSTAQRAAAAKRMKARWRDPKQQRKMVAGLVRARRAKA